MGCARSAIRPASHPTMHISFSLSSSPLNFRPSKPVGGEKIVFAKENCQRETDL
jgi:hypothetical protein